MISKKVTRKKSAVVSRKKTGASAQKHVKLKAHHARPYRKRHVGLLFISLVAFVILGSLLVHYRDQIIGGISSSRGFVSDIFSQNKTYEATISSSHGFHLTYDQKSFYASAISSDTGDLYIGSDLAQEHAYTVVRIAPNFSSGTSTQSAVSALTITFHPDGADSKTALEEVALKDGGIDTTKVMRVSTGGATLGGQAFKKDIWQSKISSDLSPSLSAKFITYSGMVRGNVVTITINLGVTGADESMYVPVLDTLSFDNKVSYVAAPSSDLIARSQASRSLLDVLTNTGIASAASKSVDLTGSEKIAALYSPAVVKIYNAYCMDISVEGKPYIKNACSASSGSGFFISQDGYLGTNGHVASVTPIDLVIKHALTTYAGKGDPKYLNYLMSLTDLKKSDIPAKATAEEAYGIMIDAMYKISESSVVATNNVDNLLVQVAPKNPDITALLQSTLDRKAYISSDDNVLPAKLVAADYRENDGYDGFKASDIAIIKVDGENFPIVKLGSIDSAIQGSDLSILGYPGNASKNGIVDSSSSQATLTTGKVSSIKNASNSDKKLIETDTTIGHGNSGGPALSADGEVVGIATYTADGSGKGDGTFNYIRDIGDLTSLASARNITFDTDSLTQAEWQEGIANFYTSHYSKALKNFAVVKELYPNNSRVDEFVAASEKRIADGQDVVDFPLIPVVVAAVIVFIGVGLGVYFVVRHHKKHIIYNAGVVQGTVQPVGPGVPTQIVGVSRNSPTVGAPFAPPVEQITPTVTAIAQPQVTGYVPVAPVEQVIPTPVVAPEVVPVPPVAPPVQPTVSEPVAPPTDHAAHANPWFTPDNTQDDQPK